ncbi:MAG: hypothetical protein AB7O96_15325 [Pseudobdellovibrionaceae bacterium]
MNFESNEALIETYLSEPLFLYLVEKLGLQNDLPTANLRIAECLKLLLLLPYSKGTVPASREVDEVWHWLILETAEYEKLCKKLPTGKFLHHRSVVFDRIEREQDSSFSREKFQSEITEKLSWLISYRKNFGEFAVDALGYWPLTQELMRDQKINLTQLNGLLEEAGK